jgi:hypothetical protein
MLSLKPSCAMRRDGRTDMMKLIIAFRNFAKAHNNCKFCPQNMFMFCMDLRTNSDF